MYEKRSVTVDATFEKVLSTNDKNNLTKLSKKCAHKILTPTLFLPLNFKLYHITYFVFQIFRSGQTQPETLSVPYLNPLVLRKEFESILGMYSINLILT